VQVKRSESDINRIDILTSRYAVAAVSKQLPIGAPAETTSPIHFRRRIGKIIG
jgi:hypothetical protein